jgi:DNA-binding response OmpR family regulator
MTDSERATVLVVDDEREVADAYTLRLRKRYDVSTAYGGQEALDAVDGSVDVVLLDRRMPDMSGDEVLRAIRERNLDSRVIMLTAIDPGFDIVDMPFDDYLCKPVDREDLYGAIDHQLRIVAYDRLSEYFEVASKRSVLQSQLPQQSLEESDRYAELTDRAARLRAELAEAIEGFDELERAFERVDRGET